MDDKAANDSGKALAQCDLCGDENGVPTGWAAETNPGTGGGTGRDEQIAVPCPRGCPDPDEPEDLGLPQGLLGSDYKPAQWHTPTGEEMAQDALDWAQKHLDRGHASVGADGRITTVYPSGESYTDPTPRLARDPIARGARGCEADDQGPGWPRPGPRCACRDGLEEAPDGGFAVCSDCGGTGHVRAAHGVDDEHGEDGRF